MDRVDIWVKTIIGIAGGVFSFLTGLFGLMFTVLILMMFVDYITGIMGAIISKEGLSSKKGYKGIFKKVYTMLLIGAVGAVEISVLKSNGVIADGVATAFILVELTSILENGGKMGVKIPAQLQKMISALRNKVGE